MSRLLVPITLAIAVVAVPAAAQDTLPIRRVILSSSGLAHLEREARVNGDATVTMQVPLAQIDDLLKSLVVLDAMGSVDSVRLVGREPLSQAFKSLPFAQADLQSPVALLTALRGAEIEIVASRTLRGRLLGVGQENRVKDGATTVVHRLSVLTVSGIESGILEDASSVTFADAGLRTRIGEALASLLQRRSQDSRAVDLVLRGQGERAVTLAYVVEAPIWKSAYRLVLPRMGQEARLQGWAVVENMSGSDWNDVELTLVSGNPVTLKQALYESYYVRRPEIPVQVFGRVLPRRDQGIVTMAATAASVGSASLRAKAPMAFALQQESASSIASDMAGAQQAAESSEASTQVSFRFPARLSVAAGQSLTVPFLDKPVPIERVWLYQPEANARHPVAAVKIVNHTESGLPGGIVTVYADDQGAFSGDAEFPVLPKDAERFVPFALDQKTLVDRTTRQEHRRVIVSVSNGILTANNVLTVETIYAIRAPQGEARRIVIEHPRREGWTLDGASRLEATPTHYRMAVDLAAGETKAVSVKMSLGQPQHHTIESANLDLLAELARDAGQSSPAYAPLLEIVELRRALTRAETRLKSLETTYQQDLQEQRRVRENLQATAASGQLTDAVREYQQELARQDKRIAQRIQQRDAVYQEITDLTESVRSKSAALKL